MIITSSSVNQSNLNLTLTISKTQSKPTPTPNPNRSRMKTETITLLKVWSTILTTLLYTYFISSKIPKGIFRFLSILPIILLYTILPLYLTAILPVGITSFFITWLASSKLLLFSFGLGPLTPLHHHTLSTFILTAAFPIKINDQTTPPHPDKVIPLNLISETLICSVLIFVCDRYKNELNTLVILVVYCFLLYFLLDIVVGVANKLVGSFADVEICRPSNEPYLSTSLQDFWGKRWNLMVTDTLRHTVYLPTRGFLSCYVGKELALAGAYMGSFLVSGLVHELIFYYMTRVRPTWEVTWFFVLNGVCVVVEVTVKKVLGRKVKLHWFISGPLTILFLTGTAQLWFFPPLVRNGIDMKTIDECKTLLGFFRGKF